MRFRIGNNMIFFLFFAKALDPSRRASVVRLLLYLSAILFCGALVFFIFQWIDYPLAGISDRPSFLVLLLFLLLPFCGDAIRMTRKDLNAAEAAMQEWQLAKKKGKQRFILDWFLSMWFTWLLIIFIQTSGVELDLLYAATTSVILVGIGLLIALCSWRLNMRYHDEVAALLKPSRASELESLFK